MTNVRELGDEVLPVYWPGTVTLVATVNVMDREGVCTIVQRTYEAYVPISDDVREELRERLRQMVAADLVKTGRVFGCSIGPLRIDERTNAAVSGAERTNQ